MPRNLIKENMEVYSGLYVEEEDIENVITLAEEEKISINAAICIYFE